MLTRRQLVVLGSTGLAAGALALRPAFAKGSLDSLAAEFARIEKESGGRLGVQVIDTETGAKAGHRTDERFPLCSTFKTLAAAAILARVDAGKEKLDRHVTYPKSDLVTYSPETEKHVGKGMTLAAICKAAITLSDNTAGNLMLNAIGGPAGLTAWLRSTGDEVTRLDRMETALNEALPGDPRDTTTPAAMAADLRKLVLGNTLSPASREQLKAWLFANTTGDKRLRAHLPKGWRVGDKTGSGERGSTNDAGIIWPPERKPVVVAAYLTGTEASKEIRDAALASVGRAVATALK